MGGLDFTAKGGKRQEARSAPIVAGETGSEASGLKNPINSRPFKPRPSEQGAKFDL
jgi:hypothetical protein